MLSETLVSLQGTSNYSVFGCVSKKMTLLGASEKQTQQLRRELSRRPSGIFQMKACERTHGAPPPSDLPLVT